jgi:hypothetical protein
VSDTVQDLKAVTMGVVAAIAFFGSNGPNQAIYINRPYRYVRTRFDF